MNESQLNRLVEEGIGYTILRELEIANGTGRTAMREKALEILHKLHNENWPGNLMFDALVEYEGAFNT